MGTLPSGRVLVGTMEAGHPTAHTIPTFAQELEAAKEAQVILDVDQGWFYIPEVLKQIRGSGLMGQVVVNTIPNTTFHDFTKQQGAVPENLALMVVVDLGRPDAKQIIASYGAHKRTIIQCIFADDQNPLVRELPELRQQGPVWVNSLWPDQNGKHDDDRAVDLGQTDQTWGC